MRYVRVLLLTCVATIGLSGALGCATREHKSTEIKQTEKHGEVKEEKPGEMIVE